LMINMQKLSKREKNRIWYKNNQDHIKEYHKKYKKRIVQRSQEGRVWLNNYMEKHKTRCICCGIQDRKAIKFINNEGSPEVTQSINCGHKIETLEKKIRRCVPLCLKCLSTNRVESSQTQTIPSCWGPKKLHPKKKGEISELSVGLELLKLGFNVLFPFGENTPYDFVFETSGKFFRVQVKTGRRKTIKMEGQITFPKKSSSGKTYEKTADFFGVFVPQTGKSYLIPTSTKVTIFRDKTTKNNQVKRVHYIDEYEISEEHLKKLLL